jgi:hypothetical protein
MGQLLAELGARSRSSARVVPARRRARVGRFGVYRFEM